MTRFKPNYKVHRNKLTGDYTVFFEGTIMLGYIKRGKPAGTNKIHYYTGTTWYPTLRDAIYSII